MTRTVILVVLALAAVALAGLRAAGRLEPRDPTPRELADRVLSALDPTAAARSGTAAADPLFTDVAPALGIDFVHDNAVRGAYLLPESLGPGCGVLDYDGDGDLDILVAGGGAIADDGPRQTCRLYRNDGAAFVDVTDAAGADVPGPAYGVACADYDDDGDVDAFIARLGADALLRNEGDGTFTEIARQVGVAHDGFGASAAFLDYDGDGRLDLYVTNYVDWSIDREMACYAILGSRDYCAPTAYDAPSRDRLYRNAGGGRFEDVSAAAGIAAETGNGLGVLASDFDGDGRIDVYVANDQTPAFLWRNRGDGTFENVAALAGCAYDGRGVAIAGMGVACEDLDDDGDFDLLVTNIHDQNHLVLANDGGLFRDVSLQIGAGPWSIPATAFGVALFDQDHDGALDAFVANGDVNLDNPLRAGDNPYAQPDHFLRLTPAGFVDESERSGVAFADVGRAVAAADIDDDGDLDLVLTNNGGPLRVLRNERRGGSWLIVDARTGPGARAAIGARVEVTAGGRTIRREIRPQQSYLASGDPRAHFGLGDAARVDRIAVRWPDGAVTVGEGVAVDRVVVMRREATAR